MKLLFQALKRNNLAYLLLLCLFITSYFEYFFRGDGILMLFFLSLFAIGYIGKYRKDIRSKNGQLIIIYIIVSFWACMMQSISQSEASFFFPISQLLLLFCYMVLSAAVKNKFMERFVTVILIIATYSIVIYIVCLFVPSIKNYLQNEIAPNFVSMGAEKAIQEGAGTNIVFYNFQYDDSYLKIFRNCGPFWEPGMFAVFVDLALFVNLYIIPPKSNVISIVLIIALFTTLSTGGFAGGFFVLSCYPFLKRGRGLFPVVVLILFLIFVGYFFLTDFMGEKLLMQLSNTNTGSDESRFGAMMTHAQIFFDNPIWGYFGHKGYIKEGDTLASGLLVPLSTRGCVGFFYYYLLYKASINFSLFYTGHKKEGIMLFLLILVLSISQTILMTSCFMVYIFVGLILINSKKTKICNSLMWR